jgi:hypothetical protein
MCAVLGAEHEAAAVARDSGQGGAAAGRARERVADVITSTAAAGFAPVHATAAAYAVAAQ